MSVVISHSTCNSQINKNQAFSCHKRCSRSFKYHLYSVLWNLLCCQNLYIHTSMNVYTHANPWGLMQSSLEWPWTRGSGLYLLSTELTAVCHHSSFMQCWALDPGPQTCGKHCQWRSIPQPPTIRLKSTYYYTLLTVRVWFSFLETGSPALYPRLAWNLRQSSCLSRLEQAH